MMRKLIVIFLLIFLNNISQAQKDVVNFLQVPELYLPLVKNYLEPMAKMTSDNLNSGWYHSAKTHRFLGFDFSFSMNVSKVPSTKRGFYLNRIPGFEQYYTVSSESSPVTPNVAGVTNDLSIIKSNLNGRQVTMPNGNDLQKISLPYISIGVGLPYHTELRVRYMPKMDISDMGRTTQYGILVKHSIKEYLPGMKDLPALALSLTGAVIKLNNDILLTYPAANLGKQMLEGNSWGYTVQLLIGIDVRVFSAYMGLGYEASNIDYALKGNYFIGDINNAMEETDPVSVIYDYSQVAINLGVNAKIGFVDLFADYTPGDYNTFSIGIGYCLR